MEIYQPKPLGNSRLSQMTAALLPPFKRVRLDYAELLIRYGVLSAEATQLHGRLQQLQNQHSIIIEELEQAQENTQQLAENLLAVQEQLKAEQARSVQLDTELMELFGFYQLIVRALSAKGADSLRSQKFSNILNHQLIPLANEVSVLANEAAAILRLKAVEDQVRVVESLAHFKDKTVVAISGGFSSGKSTFITSLLSDKSVKPPTGIAPTTAIPTYVFHSEKSRIIGYNDQGGEIDIPAEIYGQLSHEYVQKLDFNLRDLFPFIALETAIEQYENLAFIDLPGYNSGQREGFTEHDESSAAEFMTQAQCIIWVIGVDANGTISREDIEFLHHYEGKPLYLIINKADLKDKDSLENMVMEVANTLEDDGIEFEGISAYDSTDAQELFSEGCSLSEILSRWNRPQSTYDTLINEIEAVLRDYKEAFDQSITNCESKTQILKALELDLFELGTFEEPLGSDDIFNIGGCLSKSKVDTPRQSSFHSSLFKCILDGYLDTPESESEETNNKQVIKREVHKTKSSDSKYQQDKIASVRHHLSELRLSQDTTLSHQQAEQMEAIGREMIETLRAKAIKPKD
ncbi:MAG: dynamin family protein [Ferrimonas sp.]